MRIEDLVPLATTFILAGVALSVGITVLDDFERSFDTQTESSTYTLTNLTATELGPEHVVSIDAVQNTSLVLGAGNYSLYENKDIYPIFGTLNIQNTGDWTVNYTIYSKDAFNTAHNATVGLGELSSWMPTIALVVAAALVISVLYTSFIGRGAR